MKQTLQEQIYTTLIQQIAKNRWPENTLLPSENALASEFGVAKMTVRGALEKLVEDGFIAAIPSKGYFVKKRSCTHFSFNFDELNLSGTLPMKAKLLKLDIIHPDVTIAYNLHQPADSRIVYIKRCLYEKEKKIGIDEIYIPYYSGIPIVEEKISNAALLDFIEPLKSLYTLHRNITVNVINSSDSLSEALGIMSKTPLFCIEQRLTDDNGSPVAWQRITCRMESLVIKGNMLPK